MVYIGGSPNERAMGPADLASIWAERAILGKTTGADRDRQDMAQSFTRPETKTLPEVLTETNAGGWLAEGLTKLYAVEEFKQRYPGYFEYLDISPATATGVRIDGSFVFESGTRSDKEVVIQGVVPLK
jgi:hypothetical protein